MAVFSRTVFTWIYSVQKSPWSSQKLSHIMRDNLYGVTPEHSFFFSPVLPQRCIFPSFSEDVLRADGCQGCEKATLYQSWQDKSSGNRSSWTYSGSTGSSRRLQLIPVCPQVIYGVPCDQSKLTRVNLGLASCCRPHFVGDSTLTPPNTLALYCVYALEACSPKKA